MGSTLHWQSAIELVDVHKSFSGTPVLRGVDLHVAEGHTVVILGVSGSGKSVLLKHVVGLLRPDRGVVRVFGQDLAELDERGLDAIRRQVGILFQAGALFDSLTAFENVAFPLREREHLREPEVRRRVEETLELVRLSDASDALPADLSGGMRKRLAFARALALRPRLLLCDEPTAGLDPLMTDSVTDALELTRQRGITALIITPDLPSAFRLADELAFLHDGRIVEQATPRALLRSPHPAVHAFFADYLEQHPVDTAAESAGVSAPASVAEHAPH